MDTVCSAVVVLPVISELSFNKLSRKYHILHVDGASLAADPHA